MIPHPSSAPGPSVDVLHPSAPRDSPQQVAAPLLETINLTYCSALASFSFDTPRLATILCAGCKLLTDLAVTSALKSCPAIRTFELSGCMRLSKEALVSVEWECRRAQAAWDSKHGSKRESD